MLALLAFLLLPCLATALTAPQDKKVHADRPGTSTGRAPRIRAVPTIAGHRHTAGNQVVLEKADKLTKNERDPYMTVSGQVHFSKGPMQMYCDSAHYYPDDSSFDAFGNVRMEQGDTLFVYADELNFNGPSEIAYLYGYDPLNPVRMINRDVKLETDVFTYDLITELGYYNTGGVLTDRTNRLTSDEGEYIPATKDANFYRNVHLTSLNEKDTLDIYTDSLFYNTDTHQANFTSPTRIINADGTITSTDGTYNTATGNGELFKHSTVRTNSGTLLSGDTLIYNRDLGTGEAFGNMSLVDSVKQSTLKGDYGFYNDKIDSAYVTGHAVAMEYSRGDTLYMHGRYITSVLRLDTVRTRIPQTADSVPSADSVQSNQSIQSHPDSLSTDSIQMPPYIQMPDSVRPTPLAPTAPVAPVTATAVTIDSTHIISAWPRVRFFRSDMQGLCDSMAYVERDSCLYMHRHPIVWNEGQQVFGNLIIVHLNDSTVDRADLPDFAFVAQEIEPDFYNQLTGKKMTVNFVDGEIDRLYVDGSVQAIFFPEESDSTVNKMVQVESSFMLAWFKDGTVSRMKMWPESNGTATPLYLARRAMLLLPKFEWYEKLRPTDPDDIFIIPKEMEELMNGADAGK